MFLIWFHRAHRNLKALGANDLQYSPGWAVGGFLIPIWNLFRPYQVAQEIWKASEPDHLSATGSDWKYLRGSGLIGWWWVFFLLTGFIGNLILRSYLNLETIEGIQSYTYALLASDALLIPAIMLTILVVNKIDNRQSQRFMVMSSLERRQCPESGGKRNRHVLPYRKAK